MAAIKDRNYFFKAFDRCFEALSKEYIWHQWMLNRVRWTCEKHGYSHEEYAGSLICQRHDSRNRKTSRICKERSVFLAQQRSESFQYYIISCGLISFLRCRRPTRPSSSASEVSSVHSTRRSRSPRCGRCCPSGRESRERERERERL